MARRRITGNTGYLSQAGGVDCTVDGMAAIDLGDRKQSRAGNTLALVYYLHRPFVGWVREERIGPPASPRKDQQ